MIKNIYKTSLSLLTDLYQLTMTYGYWKRNIHNNYASFNVFFRKNPFGSGYAVSCGLENIINLLESFKFSKSDLDYLLTLKTDKGTNLFSKEFISFLSKAKFQCDIEAVEEGRVVFANEPIIRVNGPIYQCQLIESAILNIFNFNSLIATKAARINHVSNGDPILEFGLRRAQGIDGSLSASRSSYIGGTSKTSNVLAGKIYGIPVSGTHSHSWVMAFDTELSSFRNYAEIMPDNTVLLVDTFNTIEGVKNAKAKIGLANFPQLNRYYLSDSKKTFMFNGKKIYSIRSSKNFKINNLKIIGNFHGEIKERKKNSLIKKLGNSFRLIGYDAFSYCLIAEGKLDAVIETNLKPYDIIPLIPILKNSGACVSTWANNTAENGGNILATSNFKLHKKMLKILKPYKNITK